MELKRCKVVMLPTNEKVIGTIAIKRIKDSWNKSELDEILLEVLSLGMEIRQDQLSGHCDKSGKELLEEWKLKNL